VIGWWRSLVSFWNGVPGNGSNPLVPAPVQGFLADIDCDTLLALEARIEGAIQPSGTNSDPLLGLGAPVSGVAPSIGNLSVAVAELSDMPLNMELIRKARMISGRLVTSHNEHIRGATHQLLINFVFWDWLERQVVESTKESPIGRLCLAIKKMWPTRETRATNGTLDAADYLDGVSRGQVKCDLKILYRANYIPSPADYRERAIHVLSVWFGLATMPNSQEQAWYVRVVLNSPIGLCALRLEPFVHAAGAIPQRVLLLPRRTHISLAHLEAWADEVLGHHPICDLNSECHSIAGSIDRLLDRKYPLDSHLVTQVKKALSARMVPRLTLRLSSTTPVVSGDVMVPDYDGFAKLCAMLKALYPFLSSHFVAPSKPSLSAPRNEKYLHDVFLHLVDESSDQLLPFRNLAASRKRVLEDEISNPYSPRNVATKAGLFSALIYRGVTHSTGFLLNPEIEPLFTSLNDWNCMYGYMTSGPPLSKDYFCNLRAYGQPTTARTVENVATYWDLVHNSWFTGWLKAEDKIDPYALFELFVDNAPAFGNVTAFQLTMDYVECQMTQPLTVDAMAKFIFRLNAGGMTGLKALGYKVRSEHEVREALVSLYAALEIAIPERRRRAMGFGWIMIEHLLCKFGRLNTQEFNDWYAVANTSTIL